MLTGKTSAVLQAASILVGQTKTAASVADGQARTVVGGQIQLADLLRHRIEEFFENTDISWENRREQDSRLLNILEKDDEGRLKTLTALCALNVLLELQSCEKLEKRSQYSNSSQHKEAASAVAPIFGTRDIKLIQLLSSLTAKWGITSLLERGILPFEMHDKVEKLSEIATDDEKIARSALLREVVTKTWRLLVFEDTNAPVTHRPGSRMEIQGIVVPHLLLPTVAGLLYIGRTQAWAEQSCQTLLDGYPPSISMAALLTFLSVANSVKAADVAEIKQDWLAPVATTLLSRQLSRPGGVIGLLNVVIGKAEKELQIQQLEQVARLLITPPGGTDADVYFSLILPRVIALLRPSQSGQNPPSSYSRALCFCISRLIATNPALVTKYILPFIGFDASGGDIDLQVDLLAMIIANIDPSPINHAFLLGPALVRLYSIWFFIMETKGDPVLRAAVEDLLSIWGRALSVTEVASGISDVIDQADRYKWRRTENGGIAPRVNHEREEDLILIRPDPTLVVSWLKRLGRRQVTSILISRWLDEIRTLREEPERDSSFKIQKEVILRLQLVLKIMEECDPDIGQEAHQTLLFIDQSLDVSKTVEKVHGQTKVGEGVRSERSKHTQLSMADLKIVDSDSEDEEEQEMRAEELEFPELVGVAPGDQLLVTGLTLLLAILEGNESLSFDNTPILHNIFRKLETLSEYQASTIARLARDGILVLSSRRLASQSSLSNEANSHSKENPGLASSRQTYQEALKLLQDPILPIRAQGLSLLRSLVSSKSQLFDTEPALVPAILDIFVQSVQDDDSFLYLNSIQGLSGMADVFGKEIAKRLISFYLGRDSESVGDGNRGRRELDKRLRVGEAISQVIQRSADALPIYIDILVPPLLHVLRTSSLPVVLRSSSLTILATCAEVSSMSLLPQQEILLDACLDILSLESRSSRTLKLKDETVDALELASTHPSLRRGALLLINLLISANAEGFGDRITSRLKAVIGYVKYTDDDPLVRHNAELVIENIEAL